ncbi:MAG: hypothetical protein AABX84_01360 [Nanoarchaeota archaeon]
MRRNLFILFLVSVVLILSATVVYAQSIDEDIEGLTYKGGDIDDVNCQVLGSAEWLGKEWIESCQSSATALYTIKDYSSAEVSVTIEEYGKYFDNEILVESIEDLNNWDEFDSFDYSTIKNNVSLIYVTKNDKKQSMLFWKSNNHVVSIIIDELPMSYSDDPLIESVLSSYLEIYPTDSEGEIASCIDNDGGKNVLVLGEANIGGNGKGDWCDYSKGENKIYEAYCVSDSISATELMDCPSDTPYCNKGKCTSEKPQCTENDGGENPLILGTTFPSRIADHPGNTDYCRKISTGGWEEDGCSGPDCSLREFFCVEGSPDELYNDLPCPSSCEEGVCAKIEPDEKSGPVEIIKSGNVEVGNNVCNGCALANKCYPIGYRTENKYCDEEQFSEQKESDASCNNNFECSSNVCVSGQCVESGLIQKILAWFKNLFG